MKGGSTTQAGESDNNNDDIKPENPVLLFGSSNNIFDAENEINESRDEEEDEFGGGIELCAHQPTFVNLDSLVPRGYASLLELPKTSIEAPSNVIPQNQNAVLPSESLSQMKLRNKDKWSEIGYDPNHGKGNLKCSYTLSQFRPSSLLGNLDTSTDKKTMPTTINEENENIENESKNNKKDNKKGQTRINSSEGKRKKYAMSDSDEEEKKETKEEEEKAEEEQKPFGDISMLLNQPLINEFNEIENEEVEEIEEEEEEEEEETNEKAQNPVLVFGSTNDIRKLNDEDKNKPGEEEEDEFGGGIELCAHQPTFVNLDSLIPRGYASLLELPKANIETPSNVVPQNQNAVLPSESLSQMKLRNKDKWSEIGYDPNHGKGNLKCSYTLSQFRPSSLLGNLDTSNDKKTMPTTTNEEDENINNKPENSVKEEKKARTKINSSEGKRKKYAMSDSDEEEKKEEQEEEEKAEEEQKTFGDISMLLNQPLINDFNEIENEETEVVEEEEEEEEEAKETNVETVRIENLNEIKKEPENEVKDENENEVKKEPENEVKKEPENEVKKEPENEVKKEPENEVKKEPENEVKKEPENEIKKEPENEIKKEPENEVKKEPENEVKKEPENEIKKENKNEIKNENKKEPENKEKKRKKVIKSHNENNKESVELNNSKNEKDKKANKTNSKPKNEKKKSDHNKTESNTNETQKSPENNKSDRNNASYNEKYNMFLTQIQEQKIQKSAKSDDEDIVIKKKDPNQIKSKELKKAYGIDNNFYKKNIVQPKRSSSSVVSHTPKIYQPFPSYQPKPPLDLSPYDDENFDAEQGKTKIPPRLLEMIYHSPKSIVFRALCGEDISSNPKKVLNQVISDLKGYLQKCIKNNMIGESSYIDCIINNIKVDVQNTGNSKKKEDQINERIDQAETSFEDRKQHWKEKKNILEVERDLALEDLNLKQQNDVQSLEDKWNSEKMQAKYNKPSPKLLELRQNARALIASHKFEEAQELAQQIAEQEAYETNQAVARMQREYQKAQEHLSQKYDTDRKAMYDSFESKLNGIIASEASDLHPFEQRIGNLQRIKMNMEISKKMNTKNCMNVSNQQKKSPISVKTPPLSMSAKLKLPPLKSAQSKKSDYKTCVPKK